MKPPTQLQSQVARHGELVLTFAEGVGRSLLKTSFFRTPLQVMHPLIDAAGCACVYILSPTGGIVQGDRYTIHIVVEPGAHALVTTLAATKIYRMPDDHAEQTIHIEVMAGAVLEFVPDAAILFENADFRQAIEITLHDGAVMIFQDSIMAGRLAYGELLKFRQYQNQLTVQDAHGLLLVEKQQIRPHAQQLEQVTLLGGYRCWANWYLLGDLGRIHFDARQFCEDYQAPGGMLGSATRLHRNGVRVALLGDYWSPVAIALDQLRHTVRRDFLKRPTVNLRK